MAQTVIANDPFITDEFSVGRDERGRVRTSPTDVSQDDLAPRHRPSAWRDRAP